MSRAAAFIRKSQGSDDDISLELQRRRVPALAEQLADEVDVIDLGVHTGFSVHMKSVDEERIDANPKVEALLEALRDSKYDYLVAWDDTRLARDQFYWELKRAAVLGDCLFEFVEDPPEDELTFRVESRRERRQTPRDREVPGCDGCPRTAGGDHGRPPFGLCYDEAGRRWIPDRESGEFATALEVIRLREAGRSWRDIADETGVNRSTARGVYERRDRYLEEAESGVVA